MKKLLLLSVLLIFACSSDDGGTNEPDEFNRLYVGQFEINNISEDDFWCWGNTGTIRIRHQKYDWGPDEAEYFRRAYLTPQGSCSLYQGNYPIDDEYFSYGMESDYLQTFWTSIFAGAIASGVNGLDDYLFTVEVTSFESSDLSAVSNTIQGVIKQSSRFTQGVRTIGTFTATLE